MPRVSFERSDELFRERSIRASQRFLRDLRDAGAPPKPISEHDDVVDRRGPRVAPAETSSGCSSPFGW